MSADLKPYLIRRERLHPDCGSCERTWIIRDRATGQRLGTTFRSEDGSNWFLQLERRPGHFVRRTRGEAAAAVWDRTRP